MIGVHGFESACDGVGVSRIGFVVPVRSVAAGLCRVEGAEHFLVDQNDFGPFPGEGEGRRGPDPLRVVGARDQGHPVLQAVIDHRFLLSKGAAFRCLKASASRPGARGKRSLLSRRRAWGCA